MDPSLYPGDPMVATAEGFPTVFYRVLGAVLPGADGIPAAFFILYIVSIGATLAGAYRIGRWAGGPAAGVLCLLIAFPVRIGLAGEALYRVAFSHSHLASALTIWAIVWFLEGRRLLPLLVLSLGAYNHLLYSLYALMPRGRAGRGARSRTGCDRTRPGRRSSARPRARRASVCSRSAIVGEWKDGTQQYFDDAFVREWRARMEAVGEDYSPLPEAQLVALARRYGATYIVMPRRPRKALPEAYHNPSRVVYRTEP